VQVLSVAAALLLQRTMLLTICKFAGSKLLRLYAIVTEVANSVKNAFMWLLGATTVCSSVIGVPVLALLFAGRFSDKVLHCSRTLHVLRSDATKRSS
jgi:hypothetical protein